MPVARSTRRAAAPGAPERALGAIALHPVVNLPRPGVDSAGYWAIALNTTTDQGWTP